MGELPSLDSIILLLQKCRKERIFCNANHVYAFLCEHGLEALQTIGNHVIPMLVDCGGLLHAERVFQKSVYQNAHAWTSLISGHVKCGQSIRSFEFYEIMLDAGVHPSSHTFVALLKACTMLQDLVKGREIHIQSAERGFKHDVFVGSSLIDMYLNCGSLLEAHDVFNSLPGEDVVVWNTLISGYIEHGSFEEGLFCFDQMRGKNCSPNVVTFGCSLKACGHLSNMHKGQELHSEILQRAYESESLLENTLIDLYAKCNSLEEAQSVFGNVLTRDVVSWNALITGYVEHRCFGEALNSFYQMHNEGILPDAVTFVCILRACAGMGNIGEGIVADARISHSDFKGDSFVGNTLVDMYAKCGFLSSAQQAFDELSCQDMVSWNALITGYIENGFFNQSLQCFIQMGAQKVGQDVTTYVCVFKACSKVRNLEMGQELHAEILEKGLEMHLFVGSSLVELYSKCGALPEAEDTLNRSPVHDVTVWNALIAGYVEQQYYDKVWICLKKMQAAHIFPDPAAFASCFKACGTRENIIKGRALHNKAAQLGVEGDLFVGSALVDMYAKCSLVADAQSCFDMLTVQDVAAWNALVAGYVACEASQEALESYEQMCAGAVLPNEVTFVCALKACGSIGVVNIGRSIHMEMLKKGLVCNPQVGNTLVNMYAKCGSISDSYRVFLQLSVKDLIAWNTIIKGCGLNHDGNMAVQVFEDMCKHGMQPDAITFTCLLTACSRSSLIIKGQEIFRVMSDKFDIVPSNFHYHCIIDLHARSGCLHDADKFWQTIPCSPSEILWTVVLDACKNFVKPEVGAKCFNELVQMHSNCAALYMCKC
ncbi:hypothetical protein L7F22_036966 [Adiantum nelumboides]|nr:hypothetical protein [Adiantum nelumboides]